MLAGRVWRAVVFAAPDLARLRAGGDRLPFATWAADAGADAALGERLFVAQRVVAAVAVQLDRPDFAFGEQVEQRQQVAPLVLVAGREQDLERQPAGVYKQVETAARAAPERARDLRAPFFASTSEASTITRDQSSFSASRSFFCKTTSAR